jgi:hypothetical protein
MYTAFIAIGYAFLAWVRNQDTPPSERGYGSWIGCALLLGPFLYWMFWAA